MDLPIPHQDAERLVILDTDPGIDDAMAMLYLSARDEVRLHFITTVFGNAGVETTTRNAAYLVERFRLGVPIHRGAEHPLRGLRHRPELMVHGADGFGDTGVAMAHEGGSQNKPAWQHIAETIIAHPGQVSLLAIAPLTNLALALRHAPQIAGLVREVVVMGGAFGTHGRHGNIRPAAEANFFYDPLAADLVLGALWPVTVVGLDVTSDCILHTAQAEALRHGGGEAGQFLWDISREYEAIYRRFDGIGGFCIHDVAAACCLVNPAMFGMRHAALGVETEGEKAGHSIALGQGTRRPRQAYCTKVEAEAVVRDYMATIRRFDLHFALGASAMGDAP